MHVKPAEKTDLHPRSKHRGRYDFKQLIAANPELSQFVGLNDYQVESIDFSNPFAVKALNYAILKQAYGIAWWDIPPQFLCPPIPGRADYLHYLADLLADSNGGEIPRGAKVKVLDIGVGANCIYPLIGHSEYGWSFVGSDIDSIALACAQVNVDANAGYTKAITLRLQKDSSAIFQGIVKTKDRFALSLCNPPFHASLAEAQSGTQQKWKNLGKSQNAGLNFGGQSNELCCEGGEEGFITRMVAESIAVQDQCLWFSSLVSKSATLPAIKHALKQARVATSRTIEMAQGQKISRLVAWTFKDKAEQQDWFN
ncbi:MAG TPA: 23S rRNA (adenine(1618)-N(6))-methyltransferase RlmF [Rhodocyclaceae bacterium]|nr:23S rRNA (adenine(1618)-N(6))-methyltransferase RlmF [Rhodocyclaceae bacterium]